MNFSEIFSDAIKYPFVEPNKFLIIGVIALLSGLFSSTGGFSLKHRIRNYLFLE